MEPDRCGPHPGVADSGASSPYLKALKAGRPALYQGLHTGITQGDAQESLHPNAYGERAIGKCISLSYALASGNHTCRNTPGADYNAMTLTAIP